MTIDNFSFERLAFRLLIILPLVHVFSNTCISMDDADQSLKTVPDHSPQRIKWAVVALAKPGRTDLQTRNRKIVQLLEPYAKNHSISILIFSEFDFPPSLVKEWRKIFRGFEKVQLINTADRGFKFGERFGYKYMCKFFAYDMYDYLKGYDYYMRVDTDVYIQTLNYDVFEWVERNKVEYGYLIRKLEAHGPTRQTLPVWVSKYQSRCDLQTASPMDRPLSVCFNFYNNWHIGSVRFFRRPDVQHFLSSVNASGNILAYRWGDSTIQAYAVRLFMRPDALQRIPNLEYVHGSHGSKLVSSVADGRTSMIPQMLPVFSDSARKVT